MCQGNVEVTVIHPFVISHIDYFLLAENNVYAVCDGGAGCPVDIR